MTEPTKVYRRYTDLGTLLDILSRRSITLLPPSSWDDENDRLMMKTYMERKNLKTLLALCLTSRAETYHHWKVFTDKCNGVCVHFKRNDFNSAMKNSGLKIRKINYLKLPELESTNYSVKNLPFLKRHGFIDEREYRVIYESKQGENEPKKIDIDLNIIEMITLNPWIPETIVDSVQRVIKQIPLTHHIRIEKSSLINNQRWHEFAEKIIN
jgi:hypothetical protein